MGWGLLTLMVALAGFVSTTLNGLQLLNGLVCFSLVSVKTSVNDSDISSFAISGYKNNHFYDIQSGPCSFDNSTVFTQEEINTFCERYPQGQMNSECGVRSSGEGFVRCTQSVNQSRVYYKYILDVDCNNSIGPNGNSFQLVVSPGSASLRGVVGSESGYTACASVEVRRCQLNHTFYIQFVVVCAAITLLILLARWLMRTALVEPVSFRLSNSERFYGLYEVFKQYGFFSFFNPYRNEPYHLIKGEKFLQNGSCPSSVGGFRGS